MIVLDASAAVAAVIDRGEGGRWARAQVAGAVSIALPHVWPAEVASVLRRLEARGELAPPHARDALGRALALRADVYGFEPLADEVWSLRRNLTVYDAWYVALAAKLDAPLVTLDVRAARAPRLPCRVLTPQRP